MHVRIKFFCNTTYITARYIVVAIIAEVRIEIDINRFFVMIKITPLLL